MKVLLLDDHPLCREAVIDLLSRRVGSVEPECVGTVSAALSALDRGPRQLVIADFSTGDVCGHPGIEGVVNAAGEAPVAALDVHPIHAHARRAELAGARAYIPKTSSRELIDAAIGVVHAGGSYFPEIAPKGAAPSESPGRRLSPRRAEVLNLLNRGLRNNEIAEALGISVATVKLHVHAILKITGARSRTDLVVRNLRPDREPT